MIDQRRVTENYATLLFQPLGDIEADANGVRNVNHEFARRQFSAFLRDAARLNADLAVTPEYSMPWSVLVRESTRTAEGLIQGCQQKSCSLQCVRR